MKNKISITAVLGSNQKDMALLLQITRSQWSMFESGKRDLPLHAKQMLAEILVYVNAPERNITAFSPSERDAIEKIQLERLLNENEYQRLTIDKKIAALNKKHTTDLKQLLLKEFIATKNNLPVNDQQFSVEKAQLEKDHINHMLALQLKQEILVFEQSLIDSRFALIKTKSSASK